MISRRPTVVCSRRFKGYYVNKILPVLRPTEWVQPDRYSYSILVRLRECPRRWQLQHARYGNKAGYPEIFHGPAERGRLIHQLVSCMFRSLAKGGNPPIGSTDFQAIIRDLDPISTATRLVEQCRERWGADPQPSRQRVSWTPLEIYSAASLVFQREYRPQKGTARPSTNIVQEKTRAERGGTATTKLAHLGALSEHRVEHPTLPFFGYVDLILQGQKGAILVEIKTGSPQPSHQEQVALYALLWWRQEEQLPEAGEVRYGSHAEPVDVRQSTLESLEANLLREMQFWSEQLSTEASATPGKHCQRCPVRPSCDPYWEQPPREDVWVDAEVLVEGADILGLRVRQKSGLRVRLLLPPEQEGLRQELQEGTHLRCLDLKRLDRGDALEITAQSELWRLR
jgi:hypothetical protein